MKKIWKNGKTGKNALSVTGGQRVVTLCAGVTCYKNARQNQSTLDGVHQHKVGSGVLQSSVQLSYLLQECQTESKHLSGVQEHEVGSGVLQSSVQLSYLLQECQTESKHPQCSASGILAAHMFAEHWTEALQVQLRFLTVQSIRLQDYRVV